MQSVACPFETLTRLGTYVLAVDDSQRIQWLSPCAAALFNEDVTGRSLEEFCVPCDRPLVRLALRRHDGVRIPLRGDWVTWGDESQNVFVGSPAPSNASEMSQIGLTLNDFLDDDGWLNYIIIADEVAATQADATERIEQLKGQYAEAARMRDQMHDARRASLNMMFDLERSKKQAEQAHADLKATQQQLINASRQAGKAEIATGVLHNVGNVLNSVNVSATVVADTLRNSKVTGLTKVVGLLQENAGDLPQFFSENEKGAKLPGYLSKLSDCLVQEQSDMGEELASLAKNIEHIKTIVSAQQSFAGAFGVVESFSVANVLEDALAVHAASSQIAGLQLVQEFDDLPNISCDKQRFLQIMVNLIQNARQAMAEVPKDIHCLTVRAHRRGEDRICIEVKDTGMGISDENRTRIFSHGFTTKANGHGFGLHSAALAATEMHGSLSVSSEGPGKGATFVLDLPISAKSN
jgi:signal transduction histidine kinase